MEKELLEALLRQFGLENISSIKYTSEPVYFSENVIFSYDEEKEVLIMIDKNDNFYDEGYYYEKNKPGKETISFVSPIQIERISFYINKEKIKEFRSKIYSKQTDPTIKATYTDDEKAFNKSKYNL
jgi:hypothetical protein